MVVGVGHEEATIPIVNAMLREIDIRGVLRYAHCFPKALSLVASQRINLEPLITHRYNLEQVEEAFQLAKSCDPNTIKIMIKCNDIV